LTGVGRVSKSGPAAAVARKAAKELNTKQSDTVFRTECFTFDIKWVGGSKTPGIVDDGQWLWSQNLRTKE